MAGESRRAEAGRSGEGRGEPSSGGASAGTLVFNVSTLLQEAMGSVREYAVERSAFQIEEGRTPVRGWVRFLHTDGSVMATADLSLEVEEMCGRCLESFSTPLTVRLEEEFWPEYDILSQKRVEVPEGREGFPIVEGLLDLQEALRQYVEMARPMQPRCGRSEVPPEAPVDSRWSALEELRRNLG